MSLRVFFSKSVSTYENAKEKELCSHVYMNDYQTVRHHIIQASEALGYKVVSIDDNYSEIFVEIKNVQDVVLSIVRVGVSSCRVDLTVNVLSGISFGKAPRIIKEFYNQLDRRLTYKK
jgi:hypothetical protein